LAFLMQVKRSVLTSSSPAKMRFSLSQPSRSDYDRTSCLGLGVQIVR